jgi:hypothetical protein
MPVKSSSSSSSTTFFFGFGIGARRGGGVLRSACSGAIFVAMVLVSLLELNGAYAPVFLNRLEMEPRFGIW